MANNATISCPQVTLVPLDFFGVVGDAAAKRLINETRKPDRRAHVKHLAQLAIVAGLASSIEDTEAVSYTVLKDGSVRIGFQKQLNTNPWATIDYQASHIKDLDNVIRHGKADNAAKHARICHLEQKIYEAKNACTISAVEAILKGTVEDSISSIAARFFQYASEDFDYIWSWQCKIAMGIFDRVKHISHQHANEIAADLLQVIFGVDVKGYSQWRDISGNWQDGGMKSSIGEELDIVKQLSVENTALRMDINGMKEELSELRAKVAARDYEAIAEEYIKDAFVDGGPGMSSESQVLCISAIRDFAERLTK